MKLKMTDIPEEIKREYKLQELATPEGYIYCEIRKGMYGLPQAGIFAQELLEERLVKYGYHQSKIIPGFWKHDTKPIYFTLCVNDFAITFTTETDVRHLIEVLKRITQSQLTGKLQNKLDLPSNGIAKMAKYIYTSRVTWRRQ
jgi:hypothetical protein